MIDLHMHSNLSDGELTPKELINWGEKKGLEAIAITDHDNISGISDSLKYSENKSLEYVPGVEISTHNNIIPNEVHVTGLFFDHNNPNLNALIKKYGMPKIAQMEYMIENLNNLGYDISHEELAKGRNGKPYGRPRISRKLWEKYPEVFKTDNDALETLLSPDKLAYVEKKAASTQDAIDAIYSSGGASILAHPGVLKENAESFIKKFKDMGGDGIEIDYSYHRYFNKTESERLMHKFRGLAKKYDLIISGGTDFHSRETFPDIGSNGVTREEFDTIKNYLAKRK